VKKRQHPANLGFSQLMDTLSVAKGDPDHFRQVLEWTGGRP